MRSDNVKSLNAEN